MTACALSIPKREASHGDVGSCVSAAKTPSRRSARRIFPPPAQTIDKGHGRVETRVARTTTVLNDYLDWPHLGASLPD